MAGDNAVDVADLLPDHNFHHKDGVLIIHQHGGDVRILKGNGSSSMTLVVPIKMIKEARDGRIEMEGKRKNAIYAQCCPTCSSRKTHHPSCYLCAARETSGSFKQGADLDYRPQLQGLRQDALPTLITDGFHDHKTVCFEIEQYSDGLPTVR